MSEEQFEEQNEVNGKIEENATVESSVTEISTENAEKHDSKVDEDDEDSRKLFVGGLSWETTEEELKTYFETWGKVTACSIKLDKLTGHSRGFGFVSMETEECVKKVMLHEGEHRVANKRIDPKPARTTKPTEPETKEAVKKVFVGGLLPEVTEEQIKEHFSKFGQVESVDLPFDSQKGKRKPYVFLSFTTAEAAKLATLNEKQEVCGHKCDVRIVVPKEQLMKSKMPIWGPYGGGVYPHPAVMPPVDYYGYEYPHAYSAAPYGAGYDGSSPYYSAGYYGGGYPYGYSYPMPPQPYVAGGRGAGKSLRGTRGGSIPSYHPYARPL